MLGYSSAISSARTSSPSSALQVAVEPAQSSFFAGEEFACTITFTNTRIPVPQTQPLPSRPAFDGLSPGQSSTRRIVSTNASGPSSLQAASQPSDPDAKASSTNLAASFKPLHRKSQSVDIRTFARRNQLARDQLLDSEASEEQYYRSLSTNTSIVEDEDEQSISYAQSVLDSLPGRRRLIGKKIPGHVGDSGQVAPDKNSRRHQKAYSLALPGERVANHDRLGLGHPKNDVFPTLAPFSSPRIPSHRVPLDTRLPSAASSQGTSTSSPLSKGNGIGRKPSGPISAAHPHSRKKSVAQVQAEDLSATFEVDNFGNQSTHDLSTDDATIATPRASFEKRTGNNEFYGVGDNSTMESVLREDITKLSQMKIQGSQPSAHVNGSETILWAFAQFGGHFQVDESLVKPGEFEQVKERLSSVAGLSAGIGASLAAFGGGEFGNSVDGEGDQRQGNKSWGSYLRNAISYGGGKGRTGTDSAHGRTDSTLMNYRERTMASRTIPILSNPPTMVAVDLTLSPGESRSYTLRVPLPPDLPPSYIGKAITFQYVLTLGTNRLAHSRSGGVEQRSRLVRIPMRIYNHVNMTGMTAFYDLTNPIINLVDESSVNEEQEQLERTAPRIDRRSSGKDVALGIPTASRKRRSSKADTAAEAAFLQYTHELLQTCNVRNNAIDEANENESRIEADMADLLARKARLQDLVKTSPNALRTHLILPPAVSQSYARKARRKSDAAQAGLGLMLADDDDLPKSNLQAVELLSRNSQKVSYDISKDGQIAATLTLVKSKYRLGDVVMGVVSVNAAKSIAKVIRFAATLETHEEIEASLATIPAGRVQKLTRTVHASSHESTLDAGQANFVLPVPSGATPNFETSAVRLNWTIRLAFLTQACVRAVDATESLRSRPPPHIVLGPDDGFSAYHRSFRAVPALAGPSWDEATSGAESAEVKLEVVECAVPLIVLPHSTRFNAGEVAFLA